MLRVFWGAQGKLGGQCLLREHDLWGAKNYWWGQDIFGVVEPIGVAGLVGGGWGQDILGWQGLLGVSGRIGGA